MAIVAGAGSDANTNVTTTAITPPILINSGDTVIAMGFVPTTTSPFSISSPSNPVWQQRFFASRNPFFMYLWTLENPVPANEPITFTRPAAGGGLVVVQVYAGVGQIANVVQSAANGTTNPSYTPSVTISVPGSMIVGLFALNRGSQNAFTPTGHRLMNIGGANTALLADLMVDTPSSASIAIPSTFTTATGFSYFSAALVLEPVVGVGPPLPTVSLSASPAVITVGQSTTLSWSTTDATTVTISGIGSVPLSGSQQVSPAETVLYTLTATGPGGTETATFLVEVIQPSILPPIAGGTFARVLRRRKQRGAIWS